MRPASHEKGTSMQKANDIQMMMSAALVIFFCLPVIVPMTYLTFRYVKWIWTWKDDPEERS